MQKMQILFPEPVMARLRKTAQAWDRPVSEIGRRAVDEFLKKNSVPHSRLRRPSIPVFKGGKIRVSASEMKDIVYQQTNPRDRQSGDKKRI